MQQKGRKGYSDDNKWTASLETRRRHQPDVVGSCAMSARGRAPTATIANDDNDQRTAATDGRGQMRDTHATAV